MENLKTFVNNKEIEVIFANATSNGYGHKKINVELCYNGEYRTFTAITNNMPAYDKATDLEGEEKRYALYEIIENNIADEVSEWLENIN